MLFRPTARLASSSALAQQRTLRPPRNNGVNLANLTPRRSRRGVFMFQLLGDFMLAAPATILSAAVTILTAMVLIFTMAVVGRYRGKHKIFPPAMSGHPEVERALRVQGNTVEQVVIFLPLLWVATLYFHGWIPAGAGPGLVPRPRSLCGRLYEGSRQARSRFRHRGTGLAGAPGSVDLGRGASWMAATAV